MQYFDIILFALIAVFLVLRLRNVLGGRDGFDGNGKNGDPSDRQGRDQAPGRDDNIIEMPNVIGDPGVEDVPVEAEPAPAEADAFEGPLKEGIAAICAADPSFRVEDFLGGAKYAFEMVLVAYAEGNTRALKGLLSAEVFADFQHAIQGREEAGQTLEETLVGTPKAEIVEAALEGRDASVTVKFISEQISALHDSDGTVIEGDPTQVERVVDFWTFGRSTKARDPNWLLVATGSLD